MRSYITLESNNSSTLPSELFKQRVELYFGKWQENHMSKHCKQIKSWKVERLWLGSNFDKKILKELSSISFTNLKDIYLEKNNIESIQGFCRMRMPNLEMFNVGDNNIITIKNMRKGKWKQLFHLNLFMNKIQDGNQLACLKSRKLREIAIQHSFNEEQMPNIRWIHKLETSALRKIWVKSEGRIKSDNIQTVLKKKFASIDIYIK